MSQHPRDVVLRSLDMFEHPELVDELVHPQWVNHEASEDRRHGREGARGTVDFLRRTFGPMRFDGQPHKYDDPRLGASYQYMGGGLSLTVYVYDLGAVNIPDGGNTRLACEAFEGAKGDVQHAGASGRFQLLPGSRAEQQSFKGRRCIFCECDDDGDGVRRDAGTQEADLTLAARIPI